MKTELELVKNCIALLAAEGVEAQIIDSEIKNLTVIELFAPHIKELSQAKCSVFWRLYVNYS